MTPGEHLAEAQRLLARAAELDDSDTAHLPRQPGDYRLERRTADVMAAQAHATIAELMTKPGFGRWVHTADGWVEWA